ncbi:TetR/AcrR family transcriptional regulator [Mycetocola spongiae]|uniref:TetR/AcrR family transcriptional regulator n=1 Tax=Mycetocola spongiae TaxID=2859226 RepID=UPI001CF52702|nr:TetR/AcrR family transcriptional regulator [Mycetocola spongiae]UCR90228.1 TetR/AcrR family transcriptional regulator [Mycetocola spongiae]
MSTPNRPSLRQTRRGSPDPRSASTRQVILDAVGELSLAGADDFSVSDIVRRAGISRSSFYAHFADLAAVAEELLTQAFSEVVELERTRRRDDYLTEYQATRIGYRYLVDHLVDNFSFYGMASRSALLRPAYDETLLRYARELVRDSGNLAQALYVSGGVLTVIRSWMDGDLDLDDDQIVSVLVELHPALARETTPYF